MRTGDRASRRSLVGLSAFAAFAALLPGLVFCSRSALFLDEDPLRATGAGVPTSGAPSGDDSSAPSGSGSSDPSSVAGDYDAEPPLPSGPERGAPYRHVRIVTTGDSIVANGTFQYWLWTGYGAPDGGLSFPEAFPDFTPARNPFPGFSILPGYDQVQHDFANVAQASDTALNWCGDAPENAVGGLYDAGFEMTGAVAAANDTPPWELLIVTWERGTNDFATCSGQLDQLKPIFASCIQRFRARVNRPLVLLCQTVIDRNTSVTPACGSGGAVFNAERAEWNEWLTSSGICDGIIPVGSDPTLGCNGCMTKLTGGPLTADGIHPTPSAARDYYTPYYLAAIKTAAFDDAGDAAPYVCPSAPARADAGASDAGDAGEAGSKDGGDGGCLPKIASTLPDLASAAGSPPHDLTITGSCLWDAVVSVGEIPMECDLSTYGTCAGSAPGTCLQCTVPSCTEGPICCLPSEGTPSGPSAVDVCGPNGCARTSGTYPQQGIQWMESSGLTGLWTPQVMSCLNGRVIALPDHAGGNWTMTPTDEGPLCVLTGGGAHDDQPYLSFPDAKKDYRLQNGLYPTSFNMHEVEIQARHDAVVSGIDTLLTFGDRGLVLEWGSPDGGSPTSPSYGLGQYGGQLGHPGNAVATSLGTDFHLDSVFADTVSQQRLNAGAWVTGYKTTSGPLGSFSGVTISSNYQDTFVGRLGTIAEYEAPMTKQARDGWANYFARHGW